MINTKFAKDKVFNRDIFLTGEYIQHFKPEDSQNPFRKIYARKKQDVIDIINSSKHPKRILDVGGGMGRLSLELSQSRQNDVVLTDISVDLLACAQKHSEGLTNIKVVNADAHHLPFLDRSFDIVVGIDLFCHLRNPERALLEFHRVLINQGILILDSTNNNPVWALFFPRYLGKNPLNWLRILKFRGVYPGWQELVQHYSRKKFFSMLHEIGFISVKNINYGPMICPKWHLVISRKMN